MENAKSFAARGALALDVPSLSALKDQELTSACTLIGNFNWQLKLCKQNANDNQQTEQPQQQQQEQYLIYANCNENGKEHFWFCSAKFAFYSKQEEGEEQMAMISSTGPMNAYYGNSQLLIGSINPSKTHPILLIVEVQIVQVQPKMFALDTNMEVRLANGTTTTVAINKQGLAVISNYFNNLFFAQKQVKEFVIREDDNPAFDIDTFRLMIYGALSLSWMVPELLELFKEGSRMLDILKLAHKYDIRPLIQYCENQLILDPKTYPPSSEMLRLAEHINLAHLRNHCLAKLNAVPVESIKNNAIGCVGDNSSAGPEKSAMGKSDNILTENEKKLEQKTSDDTSPIRIKIPRSKKLMAEWKQNLKSRISRGRLNAEQRKVLEDAFGKDNKYPKGQRLNEIIAQTGLTDEQIKNYFRNQKYKEKKHQQGDAGNTSLQEQQSSSANNTGRLTDRRKKVCHQQQQKSLEKTFECKLCGKSTRQKSNLIRHIHLRHHQTEQQEQDNIDIDEYIIIKKGGRKMVKHSAVNVKKSNRRKSFNAEQKNILLEEFGKDKYPKRQQLKQIMEKTRIPVKRLKIWFNNQRYTEKKLLPLQQQKKRMPVGHEVEVNQPSSSTFGINPAGHLDEEGKAWGQPHPLDFLTPPTSYEDDEATMNINIDGEDLANSSSNDKLVVSASEHNLAIKNQHAVKGEYHEIKWEPKTVAHSTSTETASTEVDTDIYILEYKNNKNDHAGSSHSVPGPSSCPPPPAQHPTAIKLTQEFRHFLAPFIGSIKNGEFTMDVIIGMFTRIPSRKEELDILNSNGQDMEEIKQSLRQIGSRILKKTKKGDK